MFYGMCEIREIGLMSRHWIFNTSSPQVSNDKLNINEVLKGSGSSNFKYL
jgi:hypothetical protein